MKLFSGKQKKLKSGFSSSRSPAERILYRKKMKKYGTILVRETEENGEWIHLLTVDGIRESAAFVREELHDRLVFPYTREFEKIFIVTPSLSSCLMLGGAGFSYPRAFILRHPACTMDVVEINPEMVKIAREYFYLEEAFSGNGEENRLSIIIDDANTFLQSTHKTYDAIINDAYIANRIDASLLSAKNTALVRQRLSENGVYLVNLITALAGEKSMPGRLAASVLSYSFAHVTLYPVKPWLEPDANQNCILIASDSPIPAHITDREQE